jgi:hypothetical protein
MSGKGNLFYFFGLELHNDTSIYVFITLYPLYYITFSVDNKIEILVLQKDDLVP